MSMTEIAGYIQHLRELRGELLANIAAVDHEGLNWKPPAPETNSIYVLATHCAGSESYWVQQVVGGVDVHRDRPAEFVASGTEVARLQERINEVAQETEGLLNDLSNADLRETRANGERQVTVQWCILHVIEHLSRHVGHVELTRQLWQADGRKTKNERQKTND